MTKDQFLVVMSVEIFKAMSDHDKREMGHTVAYEIALECAKECAASLGKCASFDCQSQGGSGLYVVAV